METNVPYRFNGNVMKHMPADYCRSDSGGTWDGMYNGAGKSGKTDSNGEAFIWVSSSSVKLRVQWGDPFNQWFESDWLTLPGSRRIVAQPGVVITPP